MTRQAARDQINLMLDKIAREASAIVTAEMTATGGSAIVFIQGSGKPVIVPASEFYDLSSDLSSAPSRTPA